MNNYYENYENKINNKIKFEVGDIVRIPIYLSASTKDITGKWTPELYKISTINDTKPITYNIVDLNNEPIKGTFYAEELQKVDKSVLDEAFKIGKIIQKSKGKSLVKYFGYPDSFNEWIDDKNLNKL